MSTDYPPTRKLDPIRGPYHHRLDVYVAGHCVGCEQTRKLCEMIEDRFADLRVRLVDLDREREAKPPGVVAVPAFVLDDAVIFFGNPHAARLLARLKSALGDWQGKHHHG